MSNNTLLVDEITPLSGSTVGLNGVDISGTAPVVDQILTATSGTAANWQTGASALKTSGAPVVVSGASPPSTGNVLITTSPTTAVWQTVSGEIKDAVRVATVESGTLASDFENGDTVDGVVLATDDRILIKDQSAGTENGIYIVQASGAPTRASDFDNGTSQASAFVWVQEGTVNASTGFICINNTGNDVVGTDNLDFDIFANAFNATARVNNLAALTAAVSAGIGHVKMAPGTYTLPDSPLTSLTLATGTTLEGSGTGNTIIDNLDLTGVGMVMLGDRSSLKNLTIDGGATISISRPGVSMSEDSTLENVRITNFSTEHHLIISGATNCRILNCVFDTSSISAPTPPAMIRVVGSIAVRFNECLFNGGTLTGQSYIDIDGGSRAVIISCCTFNGGSGTGVISTSNNTLLIKDSIFEDITQNPLNLDTQRSILKGNIFSNNDTIDVYGSSIIDSNLFVSTTSNDLIEIDITPGNNGFMMMNNRLLEDNRSVVYANLSANSLGLLSRNSFPDRTAAGQFVSLFPDDPGVDILISTTENQARSVTTSVDPLLLVEWLQTVWEVTTVGAGANTLRCSNVGVAPFISTITNVGHPVLVERNAGSQNLIVESQEHDTSGTVVTTFNSNGDQMVLMDSGSYGALVFATNGTV